MHILLIFQNCFKTYETFQKLFNYFLKVPKNLLNIFQKQEVQKSYEILIVLWKSVLKFIKTVTKENKKMDSFLICPRGIFYYYKVYNDKITREL